MPGIITQQRGNTGSYSNDESTSFLKFTKFILRMLVYFFKFLLGYNYFYWYSLFYWCFWTVMLEKTLESPSDCKEILNIHLKDWCWSWSSNSLATCCKELTHWKRPWCWERLKAGGEGDDRGWDGWMASPTRWAWVWVNSESWWWTGRPVKLRPHGVAKSGTQLSDWTEDSYFTILWEFLPYSKVNRLYVYICESESHSVVSDSATPRTIQSIKFSRAEYWSG